ncbi:MAG: ATP phosphoribosyltransferase [Anaerolineae bacterium]|nr:ATP phosphoribosyltransferase [Anaerolineae bacterium]
MTSFTTPPPTIRISLPSKGRLAEDALNFLKACGLRVDKPNERQYEARIPDLPDVLVLFQRPADIVVSVRDGSVDFGITGLDVIEERKGDNGQILILHDDLRFGGCSLRLAVPENWSNVNTTADLKNYVDRLNRPIRVVTKYPTLTSRFLEKYNIPNTLISAEGTLETAPAIGYADMISDLVSSGQTLRDNRLRALSDGLVLQSQAALIANFNSLKNNPQVQAVAHKLLEFFEAYLRASGNLAIFANMRAESPESLADLIFAQCTIRGLQGPTISRVYPRDLSKNWYAVNIIVHRDELFSAINELRAVGGSGVVVMPVTYIFEEEPPRYQAMLKALQETE